MKTLLRTPVSFSYNFLWNRHAFTLFRRGLDIESSREQPEDYLITLLRMAIKYEFSGVQSQIVSYFKDTWLNNLNNWDTYAAKIRVLSGESYSNIPDFNLPEPASAIVIARLFNIPAILPAAPYDLSTISPLNDWKVKYDDDEDGEKEIGGDGWSRRICSVSSEAKSR